VLYDGGEFGQAGEVHVGSEEEMDFLGIPGLLEPDQVRHLLQKRQTDRANLRRRTEPEAEREVTTHERLAVLRRELNSLVAAWHHRTGAPHGATHSALRKELGGPAAAVASADQLAQRIDKIRGLGPRRLNLGPTGRRRRADGAPSGRRRRAGCAERSQSRGS
jgi:hypothetical protein